MPEYLQVIFKTVGGLGLFLYGMKLLSEGLQRYAGKKIKEVLGYLTKNRFMGVFAGALVTGMVQSSSAVTVMTVGFVNAGFMSLQQAISIVLGANIGTTVTAQLIAFDISKYSLLFLGVGALVYLFSKKRSVQTLGYAVLGFGMLFFGLQIMSSAFAFLKTEPAFQKLFVTFSNNPFLAVLAGIFLTLILQSSSATIGITQTLASIGAINFIAAVPLVFGENIGTTITAQLAAIGTSRNARRVAWAHTLFNVLGTTIFMSLWFVHYQGVPVYLWFINQITPGDVFLNNANVSRHIANAHSLFNIINVIIFLPLIGLLSKLVTLIVPGEDEMSYAQTKYLDKRMATIPSIAIDQAQKEIMHMMDISREMIPLSMQGIFAKDQHRLEKVREMEKAVDNLQSEVIDFLVSLEGREFSEAEAVHHNCLLHLVNDVEKIADYAMNIAYLSENKINDKLEFSKDASAELQRMLKDVVKECDLSTRAFLKNDGDLAYAAFQLEGKIDEEKKNCRKNHLERLKHKDCHINSGTIFTDIVNNLERISDHAVKFAKWRENPLLLH